MKSLLLAAVLLVLAFAPSSASARPSTCAPRWINDGRCVSIERTCARFHVHPLICYQETVHARYRWCVAFRRDGTARKCRVRSSEGRKRLPYRDGF